MNLPDEDWQTRMDVGCKEAVLSFGEATLRLQVDNQYGSIILELPRRTPVSTSGPVAKLPDKAYVQLVEQQSLWGKDWMWDVIEKLDEWNDHFGGTDEDV